jgi:hypothetical protein
MHDHTTLNTANGAGPIDPRAFGLVKAAYGVNETLELLSIGRTSLYAAVKAGQLTPVKFGKKSLFYACDLAAFLDRLRAAPASTSGAKASVHGRAGKAP